MAWCEHYMQVIEHEDKLVEKVSTNFPIVEHHFDNNIGDFGNKE